MSVDHWLRRLEKALRDGERDRILDPAAAVGLVVFAPVVSTSAVVVTAAGFLRVSGASIGRAGDLAIPLGLLNLVVSFAVVNAVLAYLLVRGVNFHLERSERFFRALAEVLYEAGMISRRRYLTVTRKLGELARVERMDEILWAVAGLVTLGLSCLYVLCRVYWRMHRHERKEVAIVELLGEHLEAGLEMRRCVSYEGVGSYALLSLLLPPVYPLLVYRVFRDLDRHLAAHRAFERELVERVFS